MGTFKSRQTQRSVADTIGIRRSISTRLWNRFLDTRNVIRQPGQARPFVALDTDNRYILLIVHLDGTKNAT